MTSFPRLAALHREHATLAGRVEAVSAACLGTPYKLGPLGEGEAGEFDRGPLIDLGAVDCTTFVEQVMALALEPRQEDAMRTLQKIRYRDGRIDYAARNHFIEADWIPVNVRAGFVADVTRAIAGPQARSLAKRISKRAWYAQKTLADLRGFESEPMAERRGRLEKLQRQGEAFPDESAELAYVPTPVLLALSPRIPSGSIGSLVRPDEGARPSLVSHQIFIIHRDGAALVRHASSDHGQVEDMALARYIAQFTDAARPLLGLNLVEPRRP